MATLDTFLGINNVLPPEQLKKGELTMAANVDIGVDGKVRRRAGFATSSGEAHANLWQAKGFTLATRGAEGDLVNLDADAVLWPGLGHARVWYVNLPDGRTAFSNGVTTGVVAAASSMAWGVPVPAGVGAAADTAGALFAGTYQYAITYLRLADHLEGGPAYAPPLAIAQGGLALSGLPVLAGHAINVYLTSHNGTERFYVGSTAGAAFAFTGANNQLLRPCRTEFMRPAPAGRLLAFWRGRTLVAVDNALYASRPHQWELFEPRRDFKQFAAPITLVQPVRDGIFIGTEAELAFLEGRKFDELVYQQRIDAPVVLGSGVAVPGEQLTVGDGVQEGQSMVCIAGGHIVAGLPGGAAHSMTNRRYTTDAAEVFAAFRIVGGIPQYLAAVL